MIYELLERYYKNTIWTFDFILCNYIICRDYKEEFNFIINFDIYSRINHLIWKHKFHKLIIRIEFEIESILRLKLNINQTLFE